MTRFTYGAAIIANFACSNSAKVGEKIALIDTVKCPQKTAIFNTISLTDFQKESLQKLPIIDIFKNKKNQLIIKLNKNPFFEFKDKSKNNFKSVYGVAEFKDGAWVDEASLKQIDCYMKDGNVTVGMGGGNIVVTDSLGKVIDNSW